MSEASATVPVTGPPLGDGNKVLAISDIHIGDNSPTVWYQQDVHERFLVGVLDWAAQQPAITEAVLVGDIVDFWTYPFSTTPPTFDQITAKNPGVFAKDGALARLLSAKDGAVTYVEGNHDFGVTADNVASIVSNDGHAVQFAGSEYRVAGDGNHGVLFTHGHEYTMFNAPDASPGNPWPVNPQPGVVRGLPCGHFITRMVATKWARDLKPGQTVAQVPGQGAPNGLSLAGVISGIIAHGGDVSIARALLDSVASQTGCRPTDTIKMPFGFKDTHLSVADDVYEHLWTEWVNAAPPGQGTLRAAKSALADAGGIYLGWFAQMRAFEQVADAILMGHTHTPISGLTDSLTTYVNTGFECPSVPDMGRQFMSFALIDTTTLVTQVLRISEGPAGLQIDACPAATTSVVAGPAMDYSCYVLVDNSTSDVLQLAASEVGNGVWIVPPLPSIAPGCRAMIWLQDAAGMHGSDATWTYEGGGKSYQFKVDCPTGPYSNAASVSGGATFRTKYGSHTDWGKSGYVAPWVPWHSPKDPMHPFFVWFTV